MEKAIGFMQHDMLNYKLKVMLFIGDLKMDDIDTYLTNQEEQVQVGFFQEYYDLIKLVKEN